MTDKTNKTDHPHGIARGLIEEEAWERLTDAKVSVQEACLFSIAMSLMNIAGMLAMVTDPEAETLKVEVTKDD